MARENDWDRDRDRERNDDRDRDQRYDRERGQQGGGRQQGSEERRRPNIGRSNEYGSHAGWGGQGFSQGSFGKYEGRGDGVHTQPVGRGWDAEPDSSGRDAGGGMGAYGGRGQGSHPDNYNQGRGTEGQGDHRRYEQGSEGWNERDSYRWENPNAHDRGGPGYGGYNRDERPRGDRENRAPQYGGNARQGNRGMSSGTGSQGWVGGQQGYGPGSQPRQGNEYERAGQHFGRGPKGWQRSDERIRDDVSQRLSDHPDVDASEIEVEVKNSEVLLKGTVEDRNSKRLAEDIAESVSGVRDVQNQIRVNRGFWGSVKDTLTGSTGGDAHDASKDVGGKDQAGQGQSLTHTITPPPDASSSLSRKTPSTQTPGNRETPPSGQK